MIDNIIYITGSVITIIFGCLADTILSKIKPINEDFAQLLQARTIIIFTVVLGLNFLLIKSYIGRYRISEADEWQLLIRDGKMVDAGIGAKHFVGLFDRIVRFPSSINKVKFRVETITKEMQGVVVTGFSLWSIHRNDPWKAYKNLILRDVDRDGRLDSNHGNNYVADICTSIIRVNIANLSLNDVLTKRDDFKSKVREELSNQCEGWGAWIETVEISDVQVASKKII